MKNLLRRFLTSKAVANNKGFTLIEMLIVIALIGMVATLVGVNVIKRLDESRVNTTKIQMKQLMTVLDDFRRVCGFYPSTDQGLDALVHAPQGKECKGYDPEGFIKKIPKDAWDNDFVYTSDGNHFILKSLGSDKQEGGTGLAADISSEDLQ